VPAALTGAPGAGGASSLACPGTGAASAPFSPCWAAPATCYSKAVPVYEFACNACGAPISVFVRSVNSPVEPRCSRCGSADVRRLISRVAVIKGAGSFDSLDDLDSMDENDPKAMARWARRMQRELGDDAGPEFEEMVERLERGESLEDGFDSPDAADDDDGL